MPSDQNMRISTPREIAHAGGAYENGVCEESWQYKDNSIEVPAQRNEGVVTDEFMRDPKMLYQLLGFEDIDGDGVIRRKSVWWLVEGYREKADIDGDGKIIKAEAKSYLQSLWSISNEIKQKFGLSQQEKLAVLRRLRLKLKAARIIVEPSPKQKSAVCGSNLNLGLALRSAEWDILKFRKKNEVSKEVFQLAYDAVRSMDWCDTFWKHGWVKSIAISKVASELAKVGWDKTEVSKLFQWAVYAAKEFGKRSSWHESIALCDRASEMAKAGLDKAEVSKVYQWAVDAAKRERPHHRSTLLSRLASRMAGAEVDKNEINRMFSKAGFAAPFQRKK